MKDELELLDFIALLEINDFRSQLSRFALYNPNNDKYFDIASIEDGKVIYKDNNSKPTIRSFEEIRDWLVIVPSDVSVSDIQPIFEDYLSWKIKFTYSTFYKNLALQATGIHQGKIFIQKATDDLEKDRLLLIEKIDKHIIRTPGMLDNFLNLIGTYQGLKIFKFDHAFGATLVAKTDDYFSAEVLRSDLDSENFEEFYQCIDSWVLEDEYRFRKFSNVLDSPPLTDLYYLKAGNEFHFRGYFRQELILSFSSPGEFENCYKEFKEDFERIYWDCVLKNEADYNDAAQSVSYGRVLRIKYIDFWGRHHIKIKLGESEIISRFGEGRIDSKIKSYVGDVIQEHNLSFKEIFEKNLRKFRQEKYGDYSPISITYVQEGYVRFTHCWNCKNDIDSLNFALCDSCSGIICFCGACLCAHTGY